jgi:DNA-binding MarR family transcriptional regulator
VIFQHVARKALGSRPWANGQSSPRPRSNLVDALEERGYVERVADPTDGRARLIRFTERGWQQAHAALLEILGDIEDGWAELLGRRRFAQLRRDLLELNQLIAQRQRG